MIPYCKWHNIDAITLTHLRTFGCLAYTTIPPTQRDGKFAPTAIAAVMVGYDSARKAYRLYHPASKNIYSSNQVRFDENCYPLLDSHITDLSHKFATLTLGCVPNYPKTGTILLQFLQDPSLGSEASLPTVLNSDVSHNDVSETAHSLLI